MTLWHDLGLIQKKYVCLYMFLGVLHFTNSDIFLFIDWLVLLYYVLPRLTPPKGMRRGMSAKASSRCQLHVEQRERTRQQWSSGGARTWGRIETKVKKGWELQGREIRVSFWLGATPWCNIQSIQYVKRLKEPTTAKRNGRIFNSINPVKQRNEIRGSKGDR